jgi:selenium-binding protein 1
MRIPREVVQVTRALIASALLVVIGWVGSTAADETCQSPFLPKVTGQEDYLYVWTLGVKGVTDGNDSLVTVDANPKSTTYGKIIHRAPVRGQHEAHHAGFTDDRRYLWAGGLDTSQIFIFNDLDLCEGHGRAGGAAHILSLAGSHADLGPVQRPGRLRAHGSRGIHQ